MRSKSNIQLFLLELQTELLIRGRSSGIGVKNGQTQMDETPYHVDVTERPMCGDNTLSLAGIV